MPRTTSRGQRPARAPFPIFLRRLVTAALIVLVGTTQASAQLVRLSGATAINGTDSVFGADAAYDPVNGVYLVVMAKEGAAGTDGGIVGMFVDHAGSPVGTAFAIGTGWVHFPRAVYSPHVANGAGGTGGFLVTWADWVNDRIYARRVAFPGVTLATISVLGAGYGVPQLAYSATSQVFVAAWGNYSGARNASVARIAVNGAAIGTPTLLANGDAGRTGVMWNSITDVAWHSTRNEFGILYVKRASPWALRLARMTPDGTLLDDRVVVATIDAEPIAAALEFSALTGNYIAVWAESGTGRIHGLELSATGAVLATGVLPASIVGGENGMALASNGISGTFLLLGFSQVPVKVEQIRGLELNKHGAPISTVSDVTAAPLNTGNLFAPRAVGRSDSPEWLVNAGGTRHYVQTVGTTSAAGGDELRLDGCYGPDPFAALGGGTCSNGGWLPPAVVPVTPPPPPPPSPSNGCVTPDPFASVGGGTCYNGGWLPPGMQAPQPPPTQEPPVTPPPPTNTGCSIADPFASLGGGTCVNGGWLPPGIPAPNAPELPPVISPPPPSPTPSSQGCTGADPFAALGGGTCYNGGWLPPGMSAPENPSGTPTPPPIPPVSGACATPDPFSSLPNIVGECRNGGWVPIVRIP